MAENKLADMSTPQRKMKITEICDILRQELYQSGYQYGFYYNGRKYTPDFSNGFDEKFSNLQKSIYRIQDPQDTLKEKIGIKKNLKCPYNSYFTELGTGGFSGKNDAERNELRTCEDGRLGTGSSAEYNSGEHR